MRDGWSRRQVAAAGLASLALPAAAASREGSVRAATKADIPQIAALLLAEAKARSGRDPELWPLATDAQTRIADELRSELAAAGDDGAIWLVAEADGRIAGASHCVLVPRGEGAAPSGLLLDDCCIAFGAAPWLAERLIEAAEATLRRAGATRLAASCPQGGAWGELCRRRGYAPTARTLGKASLAARPPSPGVRRATAEDLPAMVAFWMRASPEFSGREVFVAGPGGLAGYVVAQTADGRRLPAAHDLGPTGAIEEIHAADISQARTHASGAAARLLAAAEGALARRGVAAATATTPWSGTAMTALLEKAGYRTTSISMRKA